MNTLTPDRISSNKWLQHIGGFFDELEQDIVLLPFPSSSFQTLLPRDLFFPSENSTIKIKTNRTFFPSHNKDKNKLK